MHMAQLMPLPLTVSCSSKIQIGFTFLVPAHPGSLGQRAVKRVLLLLMIIWTFSENQIIRLYWNNMINLCPLTASLHPMHIHAAPSSVLPWTAQSRLVPSTFKIAAAPLRIALSLR